MATKGKKFRVGVSGATTDGRVISPEWLKQMAANYNPETFTALVNVEHIKGMHPMSAFRSYGQVTALETAEVDIFGKKQTALIATIEPTAELVAFNKEKQKLFTSMEVNAKFADTGEAYLVGLAVTDDPASLGTQMLEFAAKAGKATTFSEALELDETFHEKEESPGLLNKIKTMFSGKSKTDDARFADQDAAILAVAEEVQGKFAAADKTAQAAADKLIELETKLGKLTGDMDDLTAKLSKEPVGQKRPPVSGSKGEVLTDC